MTDEPEDKVADLKTITSMEKDDLLAALEGIKRILPEMLDMQRQVAKMQRARYLALTKEGFDEKQALELTAKMSMLIQ